MNKLVVSASPHIKSDESVPRIMWTVFAALIPATAAGVYFFGPKAAILVALSVVSAIVAEAVCLKVRGKDVRASLDGSAAVTGLLLALVVSSNVRWYVVVMGSVFAVVVVKHMFGGLGCNIWNPALMGRAFVMAAFASQMAGGWAVTGDYSLSYDAATAATPLEIIKKGLWHADGVSAPNLLDLFFGNVGGCIGETSAILLLVGGVFLILRGYVNWRVPVLYIGTVAALSLLLPYKQVGGEAVEVPYDTLEYLAFTVTSGGLMLGAFFMATDMVTSPVTNKGLVIFAVGCGVLTAVIRLWGGYPEGVCYSIILMNTASPLIDRYTQPRKFGAKKKDA